MSNLNITTTQSVKLFFTTASIGERMLAFGVDLLIKMAYAVVCILLFNKLIGNNSWLTGFAAGVLSLPVFFYTLLSETLMDGQTLGKKLLKIKVVKIDGYQAGFLDFFIRWIFTLIDIYLGFVPGVVAMVTTRHTQRLGDLAAGTAVISEKSKYNISHTILMDVDEQYQPAFAQNQVLLFSDNDIRVIKENYEMAVRQFNAEILMRLGKKIELVMKIQNPYKNERQLIEILLKDYNYYTGK